MGRDVEGDGGTAAEQERRCKAQLVADGLELGEVFIDLDESGKLESRPAFDQMMGRIEAGISGGVIVYNLRRFGRRRSVVEDVLWIEEQGAQFLSCSEKIDTSTPSGRFMLTVFAALATMELEERAEGWLNARTSAIERGVHAGRIPFGYDRPGSGQPLVIDPVHGPLVTELYELRAKGSTWRELADWLTEQGATKRYSKTPWVETDVSKILRSDVYLGAITNGDHRNEAAHPALVSSELWWRVTKGIGPKAQTKGIANPLGGGIVRCAGCGHAMRRSWSNPVKRYSQWVCRNIHCPDKASISGRALEPFVYKLVAAQAVVDLERPREKSSRLDAARAAVEEAELQLETFDAAWVDQGLDPIEAIGMRKPLVEKVDAAREALGELPVDQGDIYEELRKTFATAPEWVGVNISAVKERVEDAYEHGIRGETLEALLSVEPKSSNPEVAEALARMQRRLVIETLRSVTVTGKGGGAAGRVELDFHESADN